MKQHILNLYYLLGKYKKLKKEKIPKHIKHDKLQQLKK